MALVRRNQSVLPQLAAAARFAYHQYSNNTPAYRTAKWLTQKLGEGVEMARRYSRKRKYSGRSYRPYKRPKISRRYSKSKSSTKPLTSQHDVIQSKTRKMTWRQRKYKRFRKRVLSAQGNNSLCSLLENSTNVGITYPNALAQNQDVIVATTGTARDFRLGVYGLDEAGLRRYLIEIRDKAISQTNNPATLTTKTKMLYEDFDKMHFYLKSCLLTLNVRNTSTVTQTIDIYECVNRDNIANTDYIQAYKCWTNSLDETYNFNTDVAGTAFTAVNQDVNASGATPYTCPGFGQHWKVLKKTRIHIPATNYTTYTMSGYKGHVDCGDTLSTLFIKKGMVKDLIIVCNPTYHSHVPTSGSCLNFEWTKTYKLYWGGLPNNQGFAGEYVYT